MGKAPSTKKADHVGEQIPLAVRAKLWGVLRELGFPMDDWPSSRKLDELCGCLQNFIYNYRLWNEENDTAGDNVLRKHMAFTLLVPGGKADRARKAVEALDALGFISAPPARSSIVARIIRPYVRFHNVKAKRLVDTLKRRWPVLRKEIRCRHLYSSVEDYMLHINDWIQANIKGLGQKATAHFMRNTGIWTDTFAFPLIDVHIHKALETFNFKHKTYEEAEESFRGLASIFGLDVITLDATLWCAYANNWEFNNSDFDNYGYKNK